jgi:cell division GTPase FtsZ
MAAKLNVRQIPLEQIDKICTYKLPKGMKLKDFVVEKDENSQKFCLLGIGGGGLNLVESISKNRPNYHVMMAHIDYDDLDKRTCEHKLYLSSDVEDREILMVENKRALSTFVKGHKVVYVLSTFGRETHRCVAVETMVKHLHRIGREITLIVVKPFLFEVVPGRIRAINESIQILEAYTKKIMIFHNEDLLAIKEKSEMSMPEVFNAFDDVVRLSIEENRMHSGEHVENAYLGDLI